MQRPVRLDVEVMMVAGIGVEIGPAGRDHDLAQQPRIAELVEGIVDRGQGHRHLGRLDLDMQALRRHMAMTALEQQARQRHPLAGGAQAGLAQAVGKIEAGVGHDRTHM